jgi:hypothetical protein
MQKILCVIIIIFLLLQLSLALETEINIKANPLSQVYVIILHNEGPLVGRIINNQSNFKLTTNAEGKVSMKYNLEKETTLRVSVKTPNMETFIDYKDIPNGKSAFIDITNPASPAVISNKPTNPVNTNTQPSPSSTEISSPVNLQSNTASNASGTNAPNQISNIFDSFILKIIVYIVVALFIISLIIFIIVSSIKAIKLRKSESGHIKTIKFSEKFHSPHPHIKDLKDAERKLTEAQEEINRLKNKEKEIKDIERRIREDEIHLKKLRGY